MVLFDGDFDPDDGPDFDPDEGRDFDPDDGRDFDPGRDNPARRDSNPACRGSNPTRRGSNPTRRGSNPTRSGEESQFTKRFAKSAAKLRVSRVAGPQQGRIRYDQMRALSVADSTIHRWREGGYLFWELPRVYAVGHPGRTVESDLAAAVLYAGPGGMLSAMTAVWWFGLLKYPPRNIHVSTPRRVRDYGRILVQRERDLPRIMHRGLPASTPSQAILDYAATGPPRHLLRYVLANAEYEELLDIDQLQSLTGRGIPGSAAVNTALAIHLPQLAQTRSRGERLMLITCQAGNLPIPETNVMVHGWLVDAHWPHAKLIVEIDGTQGHKTPAQIREDHRRDFELRQAGYIVLRYTEDQLERYPDAILNELRRYL